MLHADCLLIKEIKPGLKNINVIFIVLEIGSATVTKENREVRNFKVGDHTACINVSIWDEPGKLIVPGDIIKLTKGYASIWRHCLTLYSGKNGEVYKVGEYCMSFNEAVNMSEAKRGDMQAGQQQQQNVSGGNSSSSSNNNNNSNKGTAGGNGNNNSNITTGIGVSNSSASNSSNTSSSAVVSSTTTSVASPVAATSQSHKSTPRNPRANITRASNLKSDRR